MSRWLVRVAVLCTLAGCTAELGPPRTRKAPPPDDEPALRVPGPRSPRIASYRIDARYDATAHRLEATQTLTWKNTGGSTVDALPFHLYLNGFKNESTLFMQSSHGEHRGEVAGDAGWGWIDVTSIKHAGTELRPRARFLSTAAAEADETVLEVPLPQPLAPGATVELAMAFTAQLPQVFARTGYQGAFAMVAQWFPKVGVRVGRSTCTPSSSPTSARTTSRSPCPTATSSPRPACWSRRRITAIARARCATAPRTCTTSRG
jgi:hypothetical protein